MSDEHEAETPDAIVSISGVWRCENCGDVVEPTDSRARWAGDHWQHACGDPQAGHYDCRFFRADDPRDAELARLRHKLAAQREGMGREIGRLVKENGRLKAAAKDHEDLKSSVAMARDAILNERRQLAEMNVDSDIVNAVLGILDDETAWAYQPKPDPGPDGEGSDTD